MKLSEKKREEYAQDLKELKLRNKKKKIIIEELNEKYNTNYKVGSFRHLLRVANQDISTERIRQHNEYMEKCRKEYELNNKESSSVEEAERLFRLSKGIEEE